MKRAYLSLLAALVATSTALTSCTDSGAIDTIPQKEEVEPETPEKPEEPEEPEQISSVNKWIDDTLLKEYLYNEEYATMKRDFSLDYDDFLYTTLWAMNSNTLDKKVNNDSSTTLFSMVRRSVNTKATGDDSKRYAASYGTIHPFFVKAQTTTNESIVALSFESFYPSSPITEAGITRSTVIYTINGELIDASKLNNYYAMLTSPEVGDKVVLRDIEGKEYTLTARTLLTNPIINTQIFERDGGIKVGYMKLSRYDHNFEDELFAALKEFDDKEVNEFILDLRSNPGGYGTAVRQLCSCIASITEPTTLYYNRYNDDLRDYYKSLPPEYLGMTYHPESGYFAYDAILDSKLQASHLTHLRSKRIYCLTTINTASSSELTINALRGIDFDVVAVGSTTRGKNVGSFEHLKVDKEYTYQLNAISIEVYNAKFFSDYAKGLAPEADNIVYDIFPFANYDTKDPLIARAMELITGVSDPIQTTTTTEGTRSGSGITICPMLVDQEFKLDNNTPQGIIEIVQNNYPQ